MKQEKLLTITIPAYNARNYLERCIASMTRTSRRDRTEILIVNDGSTDDTGAMAEEYAKQYAGIVRVIHKENGGHGSAINTGIAHATGTYFKVVDADDWVDEAAYDAFLEKLEGVTCDLVATPFACVYVDKDGAVVSGTKGNVEYRRIEGCDGLDRGKEYDFREQAAKLHVRMHEWTIRTGLLQQHGIKMFEHCFYVDMQYILFPVPWIRTFCVFDLPVYCYRIGSQGQSVSWENMQRNRAQHNRVLRSVVAYYQERAAQGDSENVLEYLANGIAKMQADEIKTLLSMPVCAKSRKEIKELEHWLKTECEAAYRANPKKSVWLLRKSRYFLYPAAAVLLRLVK